MEINGSRFFKEGHERDERENVGIYENPEGHLNINSVQIDILRVGDSNIFLVSGNELARGLEVGEKNIQLHKTKLEKRGDLKEGRDFISNINRYDESIKPSSTGFNQNKPSSTGFNTPKRGRPKTYYTFSGAILIAKEVRSSRSNIFFNAVFENFRKNMDTLYSAARKQLPLANMEYSLECIGEGVEVAQKDITNNVKLVKGSVIEYHLKTVKALEKTIKEIKKPIFYSNPRQRIVEMINGKSKSEDRDLDECKQEAYKIMFTKLYGRRPVFSDRPMDSFYRNNDLGKALAILSEAWTMF